MLYPLFVAFAPEMGGRCAGVGRRTKQIKKGVDKRAGRFSVMQKKLCEAKISKTQYGSRQG